MNAVGFMTHYTTMIGDHAPDTNRILLPVGMTIKDIFISYEKVYKNEGPIKKSHFYQLWKQHFPHVSCPQVCSTNACIIYNVSP